MRLNEHSVRSAGRAWRNHIAFLADIEVQPGSFKMPFRSGVVVKHGDMIGGESVVSFGGARIFAGGFILFTAYFDVYEMTGALVLAQP